MKSSEYIGFLISFIILSTVNLAYTQTKEDQNIIKLFEKNKIKNVVIDIPNNSYTSNAIIHMNIKIITNKDKEFNIMGNNCSKHFYINLTSCVLNEKGNVQIMNVKDLINHTIKINIISKYDSTINCEKIVPIDYKGDLNIVFSGKNGEDGKQGSIGKKALSGKPSEVGGNGLRGDNGENGEDIEVYIISKYDSILKTELIIIMVLSENLQKKNEYYANPDKSKIIISSCGGKGGSGGKGGQGGDGYDVIRGTGYGGYGGFGGNGGSGGNGGNGGKITVFFDPSAEIYRNLFHFKNIGGEPGNGGMPGLRGNDGQSMYMGKPSTHAGKAVKPDGVELKGLPGIDGINGKEPIIRIEEIGHKFE